MTAGSNRLLAGAGAAFLAFSYLLYFAPNRAVDLPGLTIFWSVWCSTGIILCDAACKQIHGLSLLTEIFTSKRRFSSFVAAGTGSGLLLDGAAQWLGKLWVYPYWTPALYAGCFVIGFCAYWLLLAESYLLAKSLLEPLFPSPRSRLSRRKARVRTRRICGASGFVLLGVGLLLALRAYDAGGGYRFAVIQPSTVHAPFYCFLMILIGSWLVVESANSCGFAKSLVDAMVRCDWLALCALLAAGWITGFFMETANAAQHFWRYTNWPCQNVTVCGVPVLVLVLWPLQYVVFLSFAPALGVADVWGARKSTERSRV